MSYILLPDETLRLVLRGMPNIRAADPPSLLFHCSRVVRPGGPLNLMRDPGYPRDAGMPRKVRELIADLKRAGFVDRGGRGDHRNFVHPKVTKPVTISRSRR